MLAMLQTPQTGNRTPHPVAPVMLNNPKTGIQASCVDNVDNYHKPLIFNV